jgi:hypothetical protein
VCYMLSKEDHLFLLSVVLCATVESVLLRVSLFAYMLPALKCQYEVFVGHGAQRDL